MAGAKIGAQPDQGPIQESIGEMAWLRDTHTSMLLGGSVLSAITDTWTYIPAAYFPVRIAVIVLGL